MVRQYWRVFTATERLEAIHWFQEDLNQFGFILSFTPFCKVALALTAEIPVTNLGMLLHRLGCWINIDPETFNEKPGNRDALVFLHITFTSGTGNKILEHSPG